MKHQAFSVFFYRVFLWIQVVAMALSGPALAVEVELDQGARINVRTEGAGGVLQRKGTLRAGAKLKIPERYVQQYNGSPQAAEKSFMKWLEEDAGTLTEFKSYDGEVQRDFFLPVEVVDAKGANLNLDKETKTVQVAIRYLVREQGIELSTREEAGAYQRSPSSATKKTGDAKAANDVNQSEGGSSETCCLGESSEDSSSSSPPKGLKKFSEDVGEMMKQVESAAQKDLGNRGGPEQSIRNFEKSCGKLSFEEMKEYILKNGPKSRVAPELSLAIMTQESSGQCFSIHNETNNSSSVGLFQINTRYTDVPKCNQRQLREIQGLDSMKKLKTGPQCLQNPWINYKLHLKTLTEQYRLVNDGEKPPSSGWSEMSERHRDLWRKAFAGYNGGQAYVYQAYRDIGDYNRRMGTNYDPHDWDVRRLFFFRKYLSSRKQADYFDREMKWDRPLSLSISNVGYTEASLDKNGIGSSRSHVNRWRKYLASTP